MAAPLSATAKGSLAKAVARGDVDELLEQLTQAISPTSPQGRAQSALQQTRDRIAEARRVARQNVQWGLPRGATPGVLGTSPNAMSSGALGRITVPNPTYVPPPPNVVGLTGGPAGQVARGPIGGLGAPPSMTSVIAGDTRAGIPQYNWGSSVRGPAQPAMGIADALPNAARMGNPNIAAPAAPLNLPGRVAGASRGASIASEFAEAPLAAAARAPGTSLVPWTGGGAALESAAGGVGSALSPVARAGGIAANAAGAASPLLSSPAAARAAQQATVAGQIPSSAYTLGAGPQVPGAAAGAAGAGGGGVGGAFPPGAVPNVVPPVPPVSTFGSRLAGMGVRGVGMRALGAVGTGIAAGQVADWLTGPERNGPWDDTIESASRWGAGGAMAGATIGAPLFGIGAVPGALIGGGVGLVGGAIKGYMSGEDSPEKVAQDTSADLAGRFNTLVGQFNLTPESRKLLDSQLAGATFGAESPEEIKAAYMQVAQLIPQFVQQDAAIAEERRVMDETAKGRAARQAAIQAYIMPMLQQQTRQTDQFAREASVAMGSAAQTVSDPQLRSIYSAAAQRVPYESSRQGQNMYRQAMLAQAAYDSQYDAEQQAYKQMVDRYAQQGQQAAAPQFDQTTANLMAQLGVTG